MEKLFVIFWTDIPRCIKLKSAPSAISNTPFVVYVSYFTPKYYKKQIRMTPSPLFRQKFPFLLCSLHPFSLHFSSGAYILKAEKILLNGGKKWISLLI